jgi:LEA14-like dessication related protein
MRTSYSKGEGLMKITNEEMHDIPFTTLQTHITPNDSKHIKLGIGVGRKPILDDQREAIIVDVLIRKDRPTKARAWVKPPNSSSKFAPSIPASSSTKPSGAPCGRNT